MILDIMRNYLSFRIRGDRCHSMGKVWNAMRPTKMGVERDHEKQNRPDTWKKDITEGTGFVRKNNETGEDIPNT